MVSSAVYYTEINAICIVILLMFAIQAYRSAGRLSADSRIFNLITLTTMLLCFADIVAGIYRGQTYYGARWIIQVSNLVVYLALAVISYLWMFYILIKLKFIEKIDKRMFLYSMPLLVFVAVAALNPLTNYLFYIDEANFYVRNVGVYFHWLITWSYMLFATLFVGIAIFREKRIDKRKEIIPLLFFIVAPAVASMIQMMCYGITVAQVGVTLSIVFNYTTESNNQILTDSLTGLNNRRGFHKFLDNYVLRNYDKVVSFMMIDLNNFKQVNDKYGHMNGDRALIHAATALRRVCRDTQTRLFVCRYGGDEFLIAGCDCQPGEMDAAKALIHKHIADINSEMHEPYELALSVGVASGKCGSSEDVAKLIRAADARMYEEKSYSKKLQRKNDNNGR